MFRTSMLVFVLGLLLGCAGQPQPTPEAQAASAAAENCRPVASLESHAIELARQLVLSNRQIKADSPVAVTSLVGLADLRDVGEEGNLLAELLAIQLQHAGWQVIDYKLTGQIDVDARGDLALSRDYQRLPGSLAVAYLVTGVLEPGPKGWSAVVRAVNISDRSVAASASSVIPFETYPSHNPSSGTQRVTRNGGSGALERHDRVWCIRPAVPPVAATNGR